MSIGAPDAAAIAAGARERVGELLPVYRGRGLRSAAGRQVGVVKDVKERGGTVAMVGDASTARLPWRTTTWGWP